MSKLPQTVLNFSAGREAIEESYGDIQAYYDAYTKGETKVFSRGEEISMKEADKIVLEFVKSEIEYLSGKKIADYKDLAVFANMTDVRDAAFAIMGMLTDLIIPDTLIKDLGRICDFKNGGWGETLKIDMQPRDLFVVSKGSIGKRSFDIKRQYKGSATITPEFRNLSVGVPLYDILKGTYSVAYFLMKAVQSLETQVRYDVYDAFVTAMNGLASSGDAQLKFAGYTQDDTISLAQKVTAWNGGRKAIFLGTPLALSKILPSSTNYRFDLGSDFTKLGHLRDFFGYDCIELIPVADYTTEFKMKLADNKIWVISPGADKIVKCFYEGSTLVNQGGNFENANLMVEATLRKSYGVGVYTSAIGGEITVS